MEMATSSEGGRDGAASSEFPEDFVENLQKFHETISKVEETVDLLCSVDLEKVESLDTLDKARLGLMTLYSTNSLFWVYLCTKGIMPSVNESLKTELERTKDYMTRLKSIEEKLQAPKLNPRAAKAFVRNALWEPSSAETNKELEDDKKSEVSVSADNNDQKDWSSTKRPITEVGKSQETRVKKTKKKRLKNKK